MARLPPDELWDKHLLERFSAFKFTGDWRILRKEGLRILGRQKLLTAQEWWASYESQSLKEYRSWYEKCRNEGQRFGLALWVVEMACLLKGYRPENESHPIGTQWFKISVVTESIDSQFLNWLAYNAQKLGLYVVQHRGSVEITHLFLHPLPMGAMPAPPAPKSLPPFPGAFYMRLDVPADYPPKAASKMQQEAGLLAKRLLMFLGYHGFQRIRLSRFTDMSKSLQVQKPRLKRRRLYEIVAKSASEKELEGDLTDISAEKDSKKTGVLKSRKYRLRKRLVEPYNGLLSKPDLEAKS